MYKILQFLSIILLLGFNISEARALLAPEITCITTAPNGDLTIHWNPILDPNGEFDSYDLFGLGGGFYNTYTDINTNSATITNPGAGIVDGYYVTANSNVPGSTPLSSDTLKNIFLDLNNPGNGEAVLSWNQPFPTQLSTFNNYFHIYKEFPAGNWTLIDSVLYNTTNYADSITVCSEFISYQIVLPTSNCDFTSNIQGDIFEDKIVPSIPVISTVNIDTLTNDITVSWDVNSQADTYGYVVYQTDLNGNLVEIDTVWGRPNTTYTHSENLENGPFQYSIAAFDSCYTTNVPPTFQTSAKANPHTTNQLSSSINACDELLNLTWTGYLGFNSVDFHKIFMRTNGGAWIEIGQSQSNSFSTNINLGDEMIVVVQTFSSQGETSFSNIDTVTLISGNGNEQSYLSVATVYGKEIAVKQRITNLGSAEIIELYRLNEKTQTFEKIEQKHIGNNNEVVFIDSDVETDEKSYTYKTKSIDTCQLKSEFSEIGKTMLLNVITKEETESHTLQWNPYTNFLGTISSYRVYRSIDGYFSPTPIAVLPYNTRSYTDTVDQFSTPSQGKVCYYVEAVEASNMFGLQETSFSNVACPIIEPIIYIPNAFTVGGQNPIFKPITSHNRIEEYLFEVYDRYGRIIFKTKDPEVGWDGQLLDKDHFAGEGVYVYRLSLRDGNGIEVVKHGSVTLLDYREVK
ncbi:T9SS type B sorting domain-containing protein [Brumimicrobium mesophilum]|uniref:T9SS type B sorting domain-containing protein n=1 Tax=Brumimicrobium mesophilum TaxID=392717 RepID=UPI000D1411E4|nr:gliding motility-associated C-terminal domain-containing protein [Brumimicrobium mesophilum]